MMKRAVIPAVLASAFTTVVLAQQPAEESRRATAERAAQVVAEVRGATLRAGVETRLTRGAPYSAESITEFVQTLADGNRIVRRTTTRTYRDSEGRTRRETVGDNGTVTSIAISDPVANVSYTLDPAARTAQRAPATFATFAVAGRGGAVTARGGRVLVEPSAGEVRVLESGDLQRREREQIVIADGLAAATVSGRARGPAGVEPVREELGQQTMEGVVATGTRSTTTLPAGTVGNELPLVTVSEQWFSPDLQLLVYTRHTDPRVGETIYRLTNIRREEPDRSLFQVPSDYTVREPAPRRQLRQQQ